MKKSLPYVVCTSLRFESDFCGNIPDMKIILPSGYVAQESIYLLGQQVLCSLLVSEDLPCQLQIKSSIISALHAIFKNCDSIAKFNFNLHAMSNNSLNSKMISTHSRLFQQLPLLYNSDFPYLGFLVTY